MSISSEIERIQSAKSDIITAIENQGVTVPTGATIDALSNLIDSIPSGGGNLPENYTIINEKVYRTITKNGLIFTAQNVEIIWDGLILSSEVSNDPRASWWSNNSNANGLKGSQWGLYYNYSAVQYINNHAELLNGFRIATEQDYRQLFSNDAVNNFKAVISWNSNPGNDIENFTLFASGFWESAFSGNGADCYIRCGESNKTFHLNRTDSNINFRTSGYSTTLYPIRLCKDV